MKRIGIVVLILSACFASVAWGQQLTCKGYMPWAPFHRYNMHRSNPCEKVLNVDNVGNLQMRWSYSISGGLWSSPAMANGVLYVASTSFGTVYALKANTGALWTYQPEDEVFSSPAVSNGVVYLARSTKTCTH